MLKPSDRARFCSLVVFLLACVLSGLQTGWANPVEAGDSAIPYESSAGQDSSEAGRFVTVLTPRKTVEEGTEATIRLRRSHPVGTLRMAFRIEGTAVRGQDYFLHGMAHGDDGGETVVFSDRQATAVLAVDVVDDIAAEGFESIILRLDEAQGYALEPGADQAVLLIAANDTVVTTTDNHGEGSLRQAILNANALDGPDTVVFDSETGPFAEPQTILLLSDLPELSGEITIDGRIGGRLWKATGVTLSGDGERRVLRVAADGDVVLQSLTIADGRADRGGGVLNEGRLAVLGVTFLANTADADGGGLANLGGTVAVINSTFANNEAGARGGGLANLEGEAVVTNCTFSENVSAAGGGLSSDGMLRLSNSILANSLSASDCLSLGNWDAASTHNLIVASHGCGVPVACTDPKLQPLGGYNGPTWTFPLDAGSPALNFGDNAAAVDHRGQPLIWDQRGNGDPRFVAGITDIGAFENQRNAWLVVDTAEDSEARGCTRALVGDCSLRGAIMLVNAAGERARIGFDSEVFDADARLDLRNPLPELAADILVDAGDGEAVVIEPVDNLPVFACRPDIEVETSGLRRPNGEVVAGCKGSHD